MENMREYLSTHPWLTFELDFHRASYQLWLLLGEAASKCEHIAGVPLSPQLQQRLHQVYMARGVRGTTAIEGNTLTEEEILKQIRGDLKLPESKEYLEIEARNMIGAFNQVGEAVLRGVAGNISVEWINQLNKMTLADLQVPEGVVPGQLRDYPVGINGVRYQGAPARDCEYLMRRLCEWMNGDDFPTYTDDLSLCLAWGIVKALLAHLYIVWIHPYGDGNGRTARLIEFQILLSSGVPTPAAHLLSNSYNETRDEYYRRLDGSSKNQAGVFEFIAYAVRGFVDGLRDELNDIRRHQMDIAWRDFVYETFEDKKGESDRRKRQVVLDLSDKTEPWPISNLRLLSPRVAEYYAGKTSKTIDNDLKKLVKMDLIEKVEKSVRAKKERILAFLPRVAER